MNAEKILLRAIIKPTSCYYNIQKPGTANIIPRVHNTRVGRRVSNSQYPQPNTLR